MNPWWDYIIIILFYRYSRANWIPVHGGPVLWKMLFRTDQFKVPYQKKPSIYWKKKKTGGEFFLIFCEYVKNVWLVRRFETVKTNCDLVPNGTVTVKIVSLVWYLYYM